MSVVDPTSPGRPARPAAPDSAPADGKPKQIYFVSLGCPKNRVDTEVMLGLARRAGYPLADDPASAEVIVVNTCGFLAAAEKESVDTILEMAAFKDSGACEKLVVAGCLVSRHAATLEREMPEVDHFLGSGDLLHLDDILRQGDARSYVEEPRYLYDDATPRVVTGAQHSVYVKLSEGCDRACSFCIIPRLRGPQRSRTIPSLVKEIEGLARSGAREINLIGQELTAYGRDLAPAGTRWKAGAEGVTDLAALVRAIGQADAPGLRWVRLLYTYPTGFPDALVRALAEESRAAKYIDVPLQHVSDRMLRSMRRGYTGGDVRELVERLRAGIPGLWLRSTLIVGYPGETDQDFQELCTFVEEAQLDHLGCFTYSAEPGTHAATLEGHVEEKVKNARRDQLMKLQKKLARKKLKKLVGRELEVLVDGESRESELLMEGRHMGQAPEVDGLVLLTRPPELPDSVPAARPGDLVRARVTRAGDYDLVADMLGPA